MGQSTDGQICYGVLMDEDDEFPWGSDEYDHDHESWWYDVACFTSQCESPYDEHGLYKQGLTEEKARAMSSVYFVERREWLAKNPVPFLPVNTCSGEYPIYILAVPGTFIYASRGCPVEFTAENLALNVRNLAAFADAMKKYGIEEDPIGACRWYLSSLWM